MTKILQIENLKVAYPANVIFENLTHQFSAGENTLLIGANGSGKTTLLKILAGLISPETGAIKYKFAPANIAYLGHNLQIYQELTVIENIEFFIKLSGQELAPEEILSYWQIEKLSHKLVAEISRGQKMKTALAISLLKKPDYIFLDEPSANLDDQALDLLLTHLSELKHNKNGQIINIIASHDISRLGSWAQKLLVLNDGKLDSVDIGSAAEILPLYNRLVR